MNGNYSGIRVTGSPAAVKGDPPAVSPLGVTQAELVLPTECSGSHELSLIPSERKFDQNARLDARPQVAGNAYDAAMPSWTPTTVTAFGEGGDTINHPMRKVDVERRPADETCLLAAPLNHSSAPPLPNCTCHSPFVTDEETVYTTPMPSKTKVIGVSKHPSQSASVEPSNLQEWDLTDSDCDSRSFVSASTHVSQKRTESKSSKVSALSVPTHGTKAESVLENALEYNASTRNSLFKQKMKSPVHSLRPQPTPEATTSSEGMYNRAITAEFKTQSAPKPALSAACKQATVPAVTTAPLPQTVRPEPAVLLEYNSSPPRPASVIDPLDSGSRELVEMVCSTVNSKWPILARYFCLPEDSIASIKEQDTKAEGRCWVLLLRLRKEGVTWEALYDVLLNRLHLNILAHKMAQIIGLPNQGEAVISCLHQNVFDIHNVTHKTVLLQLSQCLSEHWKTLAKIIRFDECTEVDNVHQILFTYQDADECCCEMLLQWITWRQAQVQCGSPGVLPVTFGELFSVAEAAISGIAVEKVIQAAMRVL